MSFANVLVFRGMNQTYTYMIDNTEDYYPGLHVDVPFGKAVVGGVILDVFDSNKFSSIPIKPIKGITEKKPDLSSSLLNLNLTNSLFSTLSSHHFSVEICCIISQ